MPDSAFSPETFDQARFVLDCRGRTLDCRPGLAHGAHVMGILNITPDSFSDGGTYLNPDAALKRAEQMLEEGAAIIDVGGESTRPRGSVYGRGADAVSFEEEIARVLPVIERLAARVPDAIISIDSYKPEVARAAIDSGASIINDITGVRYHPEMAAVAARAGIPLIVMHSLGKPGALPHTYEYDNVVEEVKTSLQESIRIAEQAGVRHIVTDPGFGFGKSAAENLRLISHVGAFLSLGRPVLVGISRKSTIGAVLARGEDPVPPGERLFGSLGATAVAVLRGASLVRTHDVGPTVEMLRVLAATTHQ